jgi:16S rRNA (guanine1207-N2)-methyltransferase
VKQNIIRDRLRDFDVRFTTQPGVFSDDAVDPGTALLIETMRLTPTSRVLDLACGYGVIGIVAAKIAVKGHVTLVDTDVRATRLTERNLELNGITNADVILGDGVHDLPPKAKFDVVVSNPPTHSGREVLDDFVAGAYKVLRPRGHLFVVVNRLLSLRREIERVFGNEELAARSKAFIVSHAVKVPLTHEKEELDAYLS